MLELRDGRKIVIPLSAYRHPDFVSDQRTTEGVSNPGMAHLANEGHIVCWDSEVEGEGEGVGARWFLILGQRGRCGTLMRSYWIGII